MLRPFLLRRLKAEVEKNLPPKKEMILTDWHVRDAEGLLQARAAEGHRGGEQRWRSLAPTQHGDGSCAGCNHPYLFQGAEPGPPYFTGEHIIENSGKMVGGDKLLKRLKERGSRVLIFSQMTRLLDILEDYMIYRQHKYCRIDGNTTGDDREDMIDSYNAPGSEEERSSSHPAAGGGGINLVTAGTVIIYDSDWNPQMDLQAMDRAHRIGQTREVSVFASAPAAAWRRR